MSLRDWTKQSGAFKISEFVKTQGNLVAGKPIENFTLVGNGTNLFKIEGGIKSSYKRYRYTFEVVQGVSGVIQAAHLSENGKYVTLDDFGIGLNSIGKKQITFFTKTLDSVVERVQISWMNSVVGETYEVKNFVVEELDPLPTITDGTKYLECTSNGTIAIPSKQAYGTWEFDVTVKPGGFTIFNLISDRNENINGSVGNGYTFILDGSSNRLFLRLNTVGSNSNLFYTANNYINTNTWYSIRITRDLTGVFTTYVKGGTFGDTWTLVSTTGGTGANPVTNTTHQVSNYITFNSSLPAQNIANIKLYDGVRQ